MAAVRRLAVLPLLPLLLLGSACASAGSGLRAQLAAAQPALREPWAFAQVADGEYRLGPHRVHGIGPRMVAGHAGYGFSLDDPALGPWRVDGVGQPLVRGAKLAVLKAAAGTTTSSTVRGWVLGLESDEHFLVTGWFEAAGDRYDVRSTPAGELPLGEVYGLESVGFVREGQVDAVVTLTAEGGALIRLRRDLDAERAGSLAGAAVAVVLRRHVLGVSGNPVRLPENQETCPPIVRCTGVNQVAKRMEPMRRSGHESDKTYGPN